MRIPEKTTAGTKPLINLLLPVIVVVVVVPASDRDNGFDRILECV